MICILTENELARNHGTGAQILQMVEGSAFHHFHWHIGHGRKSEVRESLLLDDWRLPNVFGLGGIVRRLRRFTGLTWWRGTQVNTSLFRSYLRVHGLKFNVAYVVVGRESDAARALSIVKTLRVPYVLHMMDIMESDGLKKETMPAIGELLAGASKVISLLPSITREMQKFISAPIQEIPIGQKITSWTAREFSHDQPIRLAMVGRPYAAGCELLADAWETVKRSQRKIELVYYGAQYKDMSRKLKQVCHNGGYFSDDEAYRKILAEAHLAFLSGPNANDMFGKWSFPSRTVDYLMAGLPILACVANGSSTEEILRPISPGGVAFTRNGPEICDAINRFTADKQSWLAASRAVRSFAERTMSLDTVRKRVLDALDAAARKPVTRIGGTESITSAVVT